MNTKAAGLNLLLSMLLSAGGFGQTASPLVSPTNPKPVSPSAQSSVAGPVVKVKIIVRCDEAAIRTLVDNALRTELAKSKNVSVLAGPGHSSLIIGFKLVPVTGVQVKSPLYAMELTLLDTPAIYNVLEAAGLSRQVINTLLVAGELQPVREDNLLSVVSKDEIPAKIASLIPLIQKRGVERTQLAISLNQQRKPGAQIETDSVREEVP